MNLSPVPLCAAGACLAGMAAVQVVAPDLWHGEAPRTAAANALMLKIPLAAATVVFAAAAALWHRRRQLEAV